jgi:hypothetical protein
LVEPETSSGHPIAAVATAATTARALDERVNNEYHLSNVYLGIVMI